MGNWGESSFPRRRALKLWAEAQKYHLRGQFERALELYTKSLDVFPTAEAHSYRAWIWSIQKKIDLAIQDCLDAIVLDPTYGNPYNDLGTYYYQKGQWETAVEWFERAKNISRQELRYVPYMNLGKIYAARGFFLRAIRELEAALKFNPGEPSCAQTLLKLYTVVRRSPGEMAESASNDAIDPSRLL